jgi:hypothetical protein
MALTKTQRRQRIKAESEKQFLELMLSLDWLYTEAIKKFMLNWLMM